MGGDLFAGGGVLAQEDAEESGCGGNDFMVRGGHKYESRSKLQWKGFKFTD